MYFNRNRAYVDDSDYASGMDPLPIRMGCAGWCACSGACRTVVARISRADYEKHKAYNDLAESIRKLGEIKYVDDAGEPLEFDEHGNSKQKQNIWNN